MDTNTIIDLTTVLNSTSEERYRLRDNKTQWKEELTTNIFDAKGDISAVNMDELLSNYDEYGAVHIINTGLEAENPNDIPMNILDSLSFGEKDQFKWGGLVSGRTNLKYISRSMRETDEYPCDKFLLPHNEILYQRFMPERLLFYCAKPAASEKGGRTFLHCAKKTEGFIESCGAEGMLLLEKMRKYGFTIVTGFLDENHPDKDKNYFRSWQDRFETTSRDEALETCQKSTDQFDSCYWVEEPMADTQSEPYFTLMTTITISAYKKDKRNGQSYMLFPRIALDDPRPHNGHRRFLIGEDELTPTETAILLQVFMETREGHYYNCGDILLVDNIRYGHSRESFSGERRVYASMAGSFWTDDI